MMLEPSGFIEFENDRLAFWDSAGDTAAARSGEPVCLLLHGFGVSSITWHPLYARLRQTHRVLMIDMLGVGYSDKPGQKLDAAGESNYSPEKQADAVWHLLHELKLNQVVLIGQSLGGGVALVTYIRHVLSRSQGQDIVECPIKGFVLLDSAGYPQKLPSIVSAWRNPILRLLLYVLPAGLAARGAIKETFTNPVSEETKERYRWHFGRPGCRQAIAALAQSILPRNLTELTLCFKQIQIPALVIWGEDDRIVPLEHADRFGEDLPQCRVVKLPGCGHHPHEEALEAVVTEISIFLEQEI